MEGSLWKQPMPGTFPRHGQNVVVPAISLVNTAETRQHAAQSSQPLLETAHNLTCTFAWQGCMRTCICTESSAQGGAIPMPVKPYTLPHCPLFWVALIPQSFRTQQRPCVPARLTGVPRPAHRGVPPFPSLSCLCLRVYHGMEEPI